MKDQAIKKLEDEYKSAGKLSKCGAVVAKPILDALTQFCRQNSEFAQAVLQSGKDLKDCIESTVKGVSGKGISDIEVYRRAVAFYFEGATVSFVMNIDLGDGGFSNSTSAQETAPVVPKKKGLQISLDDLL